MTRSDTLPIVTLTTDFGLSDPYVATMKGVLLSALPSVRIVDVSHDIRPQAITQAVFVSQCAWPFFPKAATHLVVVDPGVGTERRAIALETPAGWFVGPDNGVLSTAIPDDARPPQSAVTPLPPGVRGVAITNPAVIRQPVSATFHGRDVFAPAAAHLASGAPIDDLGKAFDQMLMLPALHALPDGEGYLSGQVLHIDRFGNVVTDIRVANLTGRPFVLRIAECEIAGPVKTYAAATGLAAIPGSAGYIEIALPNASAASAIGAEIGMPVRLRR